MSQSSDFFLEICYTSVNLNGSTTVFCGPTLSIVGHVDDWGVDEFV
jgi:hypothetical protein